MPEALNFIGPFTLKELTGKKRTLRLAGRALPYKPYTLVGSQRAELTWYPGNPEATAQILGAKEEPTTLRGFWKDRFIATGQPDSDGLVDEFSSDAANAGAPAASVDDSPIGSVAALVDEVDSIRREGQILEVTWLHTMRRGFLTKLTQTWQTYHDCEWEMEFTWVSQDIDEEIGMVEEAMDLSSIVLDGQRASQALVNNISDPSAPLNGIFDDIAQGVTRFQSSVRQLEDAFTGMLDTALGPINTAQRVLSIGTFLQQEAQNTIDTLYSRTAESLTALYDEQGNADFSNVTVSQMSLAALGRARTVSTARAARGKFASNNARLTTQVSSDLYTVFKAREDLDLRDVSREFYGTSNEWKRLAKFNGLSTSRLTSGQQILVPRVLPDEDC